MILGTLRAVLGAIYSRYRSTTSPTPRIVTANAWSCASSDASAWSQTLAPASGWSCTLSDASAWPQASVTGSAWPNTVSAANAEDSE